MATKALQKIIISKTRLGLLKIFFDQPKESFYIREAVRIVGEEINSVRRELNNLVEAGLLGKERRGNRLFYFLKKDYPFYHDFLSIMAKVAGLGGEIIKNRSRLGELKFVAFSSAFLNWEGSQSEVDFLIVGRVVLPEIGKFVVREEKRRGREINYAVMDLKEFKLRKRSNDPFLINILIKNPVVILGDLQELGKI
ncbi:hypothetical protein ISS42_02595 [Candidatus Shapirobacteria bacterium]|nr:hypothetical protein [Candidatus Shapirobacteria bacterium]